MTIKNKIDTLIKFMPIAQFKCFQSGLMGSEQEYFKRITDEIINTISEGKRIEVFFLIIFIAFFGHSEMVNLAILLKTS